MRHLLSEHSSPQDDAPSQGISGSVPATPTVARQADDLKPAEASIKTKLSRAAWTSSHKTRILQVLLLVIVVCGWQIVATTFGTKFWTSSPHDIAGQLYDWGKSGQLWLDLRVTLSEAAIGFLLGGILGGTMGFALGWLRGVGDVLEPFLVALYTLPKIALAPLFLLWFGIGTLNKIVFAAVLVFFMVFFTTFEGARQIDRDLLENAQVIGANRWQVLTKFVVPHAAVWVFTGLRLGLPYSIIGAVVGEFFAATSGLGYRIKQASELLDTPSVFAGLFVLSVIALGGLQLLTLLEKRLLRWKENPGLAELDTGISAT